MPALNVTQKIALAAIFGAFGLQITSVAQIALLLALQVRWLVCAIVWESVLVPAAPCSPDRGESRGDHCWTYQEVPASMYIVLY
eukprot:264854-Chlamydomonas_euryale.AAC.1